MAGALDMYSAPVLLTWQLTRDCNLACLHCCTDSAPGRALAGELSSDQAQALARQIIELQIPYVMLVGGEPTLASWFWPVAEQLGRAGVFLKVETNGQNLAPSHAQRLAKLPIRSIQISIDGAKPETYAKMRPGGSLEKALSACESVVAAGLPLEVTFAPSRLNIEQAEEVIDSAVRLRAFRLNTGRLMRLGTAAKLWDRLEPSLDQYDKFYRMLVAKEAELAGRMELCFRPFSLGEELSQRVESPSGTLLVLPDGRVKVSAALPFVCADLKAMSLREAWSRYKAAWSHPKVREALEAAARDERLLARSNDWTELELEFAGRGQAGSKE